MLSSTRLIYSQRPSLGCHQSGRIRTLAFGEFFFFLFCPAFLCRRRGGWALFKKTDLVIPNVDFGGFFFRFSRYFLNIFLDTTFGVGVLYLFLRAADYYFTRARIEGLRTGDYGNPPQFERWWKQTLVFSLGLVVMKIVVVIVLTWVGTIGALWSNAWMPGVCSFLETNFFFFLSFLSIAIPFHFWRLGPWLDSFE